MQTLVDYGDGIDHPFYGDSVAISPDGKQVAFSWVATTQAGVLHLATLPADEPFGPHLAANEIAAAAVPSYPSPQRSWLTAPAWSPDGRRVAFVSAGPNGSGNERAVATRVRVLDTQTRTVRDLRTASAGYYVGPLVWSSDGSTLLAYRLSSIESHGGTSSVDVIDSASGAIVRTLDGAALLGATPEGQLLGAPQRLLTVHGAGEPGTLLNDPRMGAYFFAAPSPDGRRVAVLGLPGAVHTIAAVALDGTGRQTLGTIARSSQFPTALRGTEAVLAPDERGEWAWVSLRGAASVPVPLPPGVPASTAWRSASLTPSPDGRHAAYWVWTSADAQVPKFAVADIVRWHCKADRCRAPASEPERSSAPVWSPSSDRVAFLDGLTLVTVEVASGSTRTVDLAAAGLTEAPPLPGVVAMAWDSAGRNIDVVAGRQLWRLDLSSGKATPAVTIPSPGGWWGEVVLSRSPDGRALAAGTPFGVFVQQQDGAWRRISRASIGELHSPLVWALDGSRLAYASKGEIGIVVAPVDGSGAYELVPPWDGAVLRVLSWLPDGRIAYAILVQGI